MVRLAGLMLIAMVAMAASPPPRGSLLNAPLLAEATISPSAAYPAPPDQVASAAAPGGYTAAPVPDSDQAAPLVSAAEPGQAQWAPNLFTGARTYRGEGFVPGSTVQESQRRNVRPAPGVSLNVPLE